MTQPQGTQPTATSHRRSQNDDIAVEELLDQFARALTTGDARKAAELWETPAFVVGDAEVRAIDAPEVLKEFFGGAKEHYEALGVVDTRPEISVLDWITERIAIVEVRWPWLDERHREVGDETSTYILRRDDSGKLRLRVAVMHGATDAH